MSSHVRASLFFFLGLGVAIFALLICSYFLVSAIGVLIAKTRASLMTVAVASHSAILIAYLMIFFQGMGGSTFISGMILIAFVALVFFSPWIALWRSVFRNTR